MQLRLYNTLSGKSEDFVPIDRNNVRMYVCGPTVYDRAHLGNARPAVVFDVLYRLLNVLYPNVTYVRNITDIDDKIYKASIEKNISLQELTEENIEFYHKDMESLNVLSPEIEPKATEHIPDIIDFIAKLIDNGSAYITNDHVYFDISKFDKYGELSKKNIDDLVSGSRIEISENKRNPLDFVLWKPSDENFKIGWDSPWGKGRPGWHIECSVMSYKHIGMPFDIHGGGIDLVFPHHENEIAQSCAYSKCSILANHWIHNGHLNVDGVKMSKSLGNFLTVHDILKEYDGEVIRLAFLMTHYPSPINFSNSILRQAKSILDRWYNAVKDVEIIKDFDTLDNAVLEALLDNMNTPLAISRIHNLVDDINIKYDNYKANVFVYTAQKLLGLLYKTSESCFKSDISEQEIALINDLIEQRNIAKINRDYQKADEIRNELLEKGIIIEDSKQGTTWKKV